MMRYGTIVADPPWPYNGKGPVGRLKRDGTPAENVSSRVKYGAMTIDEIAALMPPAAERAHLFLWTTNAFVCEAHEICRAWGFEPKALCTWVKVHKDDRSKPSCKTGHWFRGATEHWVFGVRGQLRLAVDEALPTAWLWPRLPHSVKPDAFYDLVERVSPGPRVELFARRARFGWDYWGDQSLGTIEMPTAVTG